MSHAGQGCRSRGDTPAGDRPSFPPDGAQVILRNGHPWQGYTGTVTYDAPIPGTIAVELYELPGTQAGVTNPAQVRMLPKEERR